MTMSLSLIPGIYTDAAKSRVSVHDPSVCKDISTGTYYVFGSHIDAAKTAAQQSYINTYLCCAAVFFRHFPEC